MCNHAYLVLSQLTTIESVMRSLDLWQFAPPVPEAFDSVEPFCVDTMNAGEWLQWVFLPRMQALIEADVALPRDFSMLPYFEEALKSHHDQIQTLFDEITQLENLLNQPT